MNSKVRVATSATPYLKNSEESTSEEKLLSVLDSGLRHGYNGPKNHLSRNPTIWAQFFGDQLRRKLSKKEGGKEDGVSKIEVYIMSELGIAKVLENAN
jgi:hypothetical protein